MVIPADLVESLGCGDDRSWVLSFAQLLHLIDTGLHFSQMTLVRLLSVASPLVALGLRLANQQRHHYQTDDNCADKLTLLTFLASY